MPTSKRIRAREERFDKMKSGQLIKSIWKKKLPPGGFDKTLIESVEKVDTADDLAEAMPSTAESSSATEASLARAASSISVVSLPPPKNAHNPRKREREQLRIMKLGEPGRLSLLASTFSSAESRAHLSRGPEMSWEEVKGAVRDSPSPSPTPSPSPSPLKRNFDDSDDEGEERPQPSMMSRFEERTALIDVYAVPTDPSTTYHPTMPRRKQAHEQLRIMKLGEPGRLAFLASTFSSAGSRARLIKPGEPAMSWEEVKAAVRESPSPSSLKRKYGGDDEEEEETSWPAKMSGFEERTDLINVYALPTDPYMAYHPRMPRRKHALPTDDEEELHRRKKQRCDGIPSIFRPRRTSTTRDEISPIFGPITDPLFDAVGYESPHQGPKEVDALNYPAPSVPKVEVESFLPAAQAVASTISVAINNATPSVSKIQIERSPPPAEAITNTITPSSQQPRDTQIMIPDSPVTSPQAQRANSSHSDSDSDKAREGDKITLTSSESMGDTIRARAQICLRKARRRARRSNDKRLVNKMEESERFARELGPIKHTATRPPPRLDEDKDKEASEPPEGIEKLVESNTVVENMREIGNEARRRADFWTEESEVVEAKWEQMEKDKGTLIKMRERILKHMSGKESSLRE